MWASRTKLRLIGALAAIVLIAGAACSTPGVINIGPVRLEITAWAGSFLQSLFPLPLTTKLALSKNEEFCDLPSEDDIASAFRISGDIDLSKFIRLSGLELVQTELNATQGNFNWLTEVIVRWHPADVNGTAPDPIILGTASAPNGFDTVVIIVPPEPVDFLELIELNDMRDNPGDCPVLEIEFDFRSIPLQDVEYETNITIDGFAQITL